MCLSLRESVAFSSQFTGGYLNHIQISIVRPPLVFPRMSVPYLLDVVVGECAAILQLLSGKDQSLLVRGNALLVLDLGLNIVDCIGRLNLEGDGLARQGLDEAVM
jgi:hypothetical protein